jgi:anion-transporting  ArsA/GET3 family ATPase
MVTAPNAFAVDRAEAFYRTLESARVPCAGLIVNRVLPRSLFDQAPTAPAGGHGADLPEAVARKLVRTFADLHAVAQDEYASIERLRQRLHLDGRLTEVPAFPSDLASLADVARFGRLLMEGDGPTAPDAAPSPSQRDDTGEDAGSAGR